MGRLRSAVHPLHTQARVCQFFRKHQVLGTTGQCPYPTCSLPGDAGRARSPCATHPAPVDAGQRCLPPQVTAPEPSTSPGVWSCPCQPRVSPVPSVLFPLELPDVPGPLSCAVPVWQVLLSLQGLEDRLPRGPGWTRALCSSRSISSCLASPSVRRLWPWACRGGCGYPGVTGGRPLTGAGCQPLCRGPQESPPPVCVRLGPVASAWARPGHPPDAWSGLC